MKYIYIGTTSINRPELHKTNIPDWLKWINQDRNNYKIIWFINIDIISKINSSYEDTQLNYENILKNNIDELYFLKHTEEKGNFMKACIRLVNAINNHIDDTILYKNINPFTDIYILWLEDDWTINLSYDIKLYELIDRYLTNYSVLNLSFVRNNYIWALAPCIISYSFWYNNHYKAWNNAQENEDPENYLGQFYLNNVNTDEKNIYNLTIICKNIKKSYLENNNFLNYKNSYYTYNNIFNNLHINNKYIENNKIKNEFDNIDLFIRITPKLCDDIGRSYMKENHNLIKNFNSIEIYKDIK